MYKKILIIIIFISSISYLKAYSFIMNESTNNITITKHSYIYFDTSKKKNFKQIKKEQFSSFDNDKGMKKREDIINDGNYREDITVNAPNSEEGFFLVPKVID